MSEYGDIEQTMVPGTLRGYREWIVTPAGLQAMNFPVIWGPGMNTAQCGGQALRSPGYARIDHGTAPQRDCTCGFYARHTPVACGASGVIKASGRVILGTKGFRAQYAEIEALCYYPNMPILANYKVPVYMNFDQMIRDFPPISVEHLLPEPEPGRWDSAVPHGSGPIISFSTTPEGITRLMAMFMNTSPEPKETE